MLLGLLLGIVGTSLVWGLVVGLCLSARERDEREALRYDEQWIEMSGSGFVPGDRILVDTEPLNVHVAISAEPPEIAPWVNGGDAA